MAKFKPSRKFTAKKPKAKKNAGRAKSGGNKWRSYVGSSSAPIPD